MGDGVAHNILFHILIEGSARSIIMHTLQDHASLLRGPIHIISYLLKVNTIREVFLDQL
jgi:hypothetical protein